MHRGVARGDGEAVLGPLLAGLIAYSELHFAHEEQLLERHGYPGLEAHKQQHEALARTVLAVRKAYEAGEPSLPAEVENLLATWLQHHTGEIDSGYGPFLTSKGVR
jgi:hemerythrin